MPIQTPSDPKREADRPNVGKAESNGMWIRYLSAMLGAWLVFSAFSWPHSASAQTNIWVTGALICVASLAGIAKPALRWAVTALSVWLFFSTLLLTNSSFVRSWHDTLIAVLILTLSLVPNGSARGTGTGRPRAV
jgi:hypothetical protein